MNGCLACNADNSACVKPLGGYFCSGNSCTACLKDCATCADVTSCLTCPVTITPVNSADTGNKKRCPPPCNAPATYLDKTTDYVCKNCPANCATCEWDISKTDNVKCKTVNKGYFLSADRATQCSANFDSCSSASAGTCKAGFYLNADGACVACSLDCATCSSATVCTSCKPGGSMTKDSRCVPNCAGNPRTFPDITTYSCVNCMANCL